MMGRRSGGVGVEIVRERRVCVAIVEAGRASAADPRATFEPQRR